MTSTSASNEPAAGLYADWPDTSTSDAGRPGQMLYCGHTYCHACLATFLRINLLGFNSPFPFHCARPHCPYEITDYDAEPALSAKDYARWQRKRLESDMRNKIYCPNKHCSALLDVTATISMVNAKRENRAIVCEQCFHVACVHCRVSWHNGYSCRDYETLPMAERKNEDDLVLRMAAHFDWARCLNCRTLIELSEGSNHITCQCGTQL
ncbi:hypothetical protein SYNPS1DRAFT_15504 [Syncephalis pseudoplumigaleata]|uniref:RBR-type E3 ubiquitin transferase n=1 Tax=Syncephalis pseudoplumigaleata TaxID=1712513 RepID=A0A4P9Z275_9FUNG|nr:hypothetical protein SYNPS1DRAFT_15504 [Syncephalis pseudoplumigaleata]|eukprot:RKP25550.1 hypothetical protein SYNPS1DRAFT_15504 [Syncephalis pseudoplumigaleata]